MFIVEGNIGSGKSTLLNNIHEYAKKCEKDILIIQEPVDSWMNFKNSEEQSIFELYYTNPKLYAFPFQMHVLNTRYNLLNKNKGYNVLAERSIYTDKHIFTKSLFENNILDDISFNIINEWVDTLVHNIHIDGFIYLQVQPNECYKRMQKRNRIPEKNIKFEYLTNLHNKHEEWLLNEPNCIIINDNTQEDIEKIFTFMNNISPL
jgi:deoxyadenosine/deoxycytidine kinase